MQFGQKKKDAPDAGGDYLRRFKKGETKVRFLDEPDEWIAYREHFTKDRKGFPCTEDRATCPGCLHESEDVRKAGRKYATQVLLVKQNQVLPFTVPVTLSDRLAVRAERNGGTLTNRDYVVLRSGDGFDTEYDVDQEDKYPVDLSDLRSKVTIEIQDCFQAAFNEVWGSVDKPKLQTTAAEDREAAQDDKPPFSGSATSQSASEAAAGDVTLTEAEIRKMEKPQLRELCDKAGVKYDNDDTASELVEKLLAAFGEG